MTDIHKLAASDLYRRCDPGQFSFTTTDELETVQSVIGQPRAVEALQFGMEIQEEGYNIFALGPPGTGKRSVIDRFFRRRAGEEQVPVDWCYVNNFEETHEPRAIHLPAGMGVEFRRDIEELLSELRTSLSAAFESDEYQTRRQSITQEFQEKQSEAFEELRQRAERQQVALIRTPAGLAVAPVKDGEVLSPEELEDMSEEDQERLRSNVQEIQDDMQEILRQVPRWQREMQDQLKELNHEMAQLAIGGLFDELRGTYAEFDPILQHLDAVEQDVVQNAEHFLERGEQNPQAESLRQMMAGRQGADRDEALLRRYRVNVLVDHSDSEGAPVIYEENPTYQNLVGRVEHRAQMGALFTDFNLIKPGAIHRANGGYLLLDARKVLTQPYAWEGLKRALNSAEVRIESLGQALSLISTITLEPEPIPLDIKVALFGDRMLYYLLWQLDPEFADLFKVEADFETDMDRDGENHQLYGRLIGTLVERHDLRPFDAGAVARVIERSARMVGDAEKLSIRMRGVTDLLRESSHWAEKAGQDVVTADSVQKAIDAQTHRADRLRERMQEAILRDTVLIDTEGQVEGQINGLSVISLGNFMFGRPTRITARVSMGKGEVVDIEREVDLGGPIHSKGVMILSGFLSARYAKDKPLSLSASLVFEQSYGGVEGDSASSAELYTLLSAIAKTPIRQSLAVTGSVNQRGQVQAIGGVNEKIEGFFDICQARGLTGDQGVLIPTSNVKHLMLRQDVIDAVTDGDFHIYPVQTIDQGIEILTGLPAGKRDEEGRYPEDSINGRVERRLAEMARQRASFGKPEED